MNAHIEKLSFKMETLKDVANIVQPDMNGASIDLKDAYYHILIVKKHRKYLRVILRYYVKPLYIHK